MTNEYTISMTPGEAMDTIHISQSDCGLRTLKFNLVNGGIAYNIPSGATALITGKKPDGLGFTYEMDITLNAVSIDVEEQMSAVPGPVICEIVIEDDDERIASSNFTIEVEPSPLEDAVLSDSDMQAIHTAVSSINSAIEAAEDAADSAEEAASAVTGVVKWNNRQGNVVPENGDYSASQITRGSGTVESALQALEAPAAVTNLVTGIDYQKIGGLVFVYIDRSTSAGSGELLATLPAGYRPVHKVLVANAYQGVWRTKVEDESTYYYAPSITYIEIGTDGKITHVGESTHTVAYQKATICFPAASS